MLDQLKELERKASQKLNEISDIKGLEAWRVRYLGKKSELIKILRSLATLPLEERKTVGANANEVKAKLENSLEQKKQGLQEAQLAVSTKEKHIDRLYNDIEKFFDFIKDKTRPATMAGFYDNFKRFNQ